MQNFYNSFLVKSPYFHTVSRNSDPSYLEPVFRAAVEAILKESAAAGQPLFLFETYRSPQRQQFLFQQGATELRDVSCHGYGLAADFCKDLYGQPSWLGDFGFLGELAKKHGLVWGGMWREFPDYGHVQRIAVADQAKLFNGTWFPDESYSPTMVSV
jgi:peptidoglycan L-alanyl-D-glutamate endopeptidase CwlK